MRQRKTTQPKGSITGQDYWKSYMSEKQIEEMQNRYRIGLNELGNPEGGTLHGTDETPFYGSDADREIYYLEDK